MHSLFDPKQLPWRRRPAEPGHQFMTEYYSSTSEILWDVFLASVPLLIGIWFRPRASVFATAVIISYWLTNTFATIGLFWYYVFSIIIWWALESYGEYRDLIQPGKKPTVMGWFRITALVKLARVNVFKPPRLKPDEEPYRGRLFSLKKRKGPRPTVKKAAPTRQADQKASPAMFYRLAHLLRMYQFADAQTLQIKMSLLEDGIQALFWNLGERSSGAINQREEWGGEIAHVHATDGSLHLLLHPEDVKTVIDAGWGERHPLCANNKRLFRFLYHGLREKPLPVPEGWTLIYAPRNNNELDTIRPIITAAIWYATGGALHPITISTAYPDPTAHTDLPKRYPWWEWLYGLVPAPPASKTIRPCTCGPNCSGTRPTNSTDSSEKAASKTPTTKSNTQTQRTQDGQTPGEEKDQQQVDYDERIDQAMRELDRILEERQRESQRRRTSTTDGQAEDGDGDENKPTETNRPPDTPPEPPPPAPAPISDPGGGGRRVGRLARRMYPLSFSSQETGNEPSQRKERRRSRRRESDPGVGTGRTPRRAEGGLHSPVAGAGAGAGRRLGAVREESPRNNAGGNNNNKNEDDGENNAWEEWDDFF
ncbi:hypothetical protein QBC44DRAFT_322979 [Cladorrhinum sp. PSN332]|nr:hypothetical protein QBC44DRAFT_322979 [Cladorrhinum sp. PSN332]